MIATKPGMDRLKSAKEGAWKEGLAKLVELVKEDFNPPGKLEVGSR